MKGPCTRAHGFGTAAILSLSACNTKQNSNGPQDVQTASAQKAAGGKTIAAGLDQNSKFMAAAKIAGLDQTLAGPGPYTVFVPTKFWRFLRPRPGHLMLYRVTGRS